MRFTRLPRTAKPTKSTRTTIPIKTARYTRPTRLWLYYKAAPSSVIEPEPVMVRLPAHRGKLGLTAVSAPSFTLANCSLPSRMQNKYMKKITA